MRSLGVKEVVRGRRVVTTNPDTSLPCPDDKVNRLFRADPPNKRWGEPLCAIGSRTMASDFPYVPAWSGTVYVAFVIDVFARRIVGWRVSTSMTTKFVLDALDQAIWQRKTPDNNILIHHSGRGSQGGFKRSSQHLFDGGCDDDWTAAFGSGRACYADFSWPTAGCAPRTCQTFPGIDCRGSVQ